MTATDELRHMLDERRVEYDTRDGKTIKNTYWDDSDGRRWGYTSDESGAIKDRQLFLVHGRMDITPAQAIAATLGSGTCHNVHEPPKDETFWPAPHFKCSECGATHVSMEYVYFCPNCGRKVVDE